MKRFVVLSLCWIFPALGICADGPAAQEYFQIPLESEMSSRYTRSDMEMTRLGLEFAGLKPKKLAEIKAKLLIQGEWLNQDLVTNPEALLEFNQATEKVLKDLAQFDRLPAFETYYAERQKRSNRIRGVCLADYIATSAMFLALPSGTWLFVGGVNAAAMNSVSHCGVQICPRGFEVSDFVCVKSMADAVKKHVVENGVVQEFYKTPLCEAGFQATEAIISGAQRGAKYCSEIASCIYDNRLSKLCVNLSPHALAGELPDQVVKKHLGACLSSSQHFWAWKLPLGILATCALSGVAVSYSDEIGLTVGAGKSYLTDRALTGVRSTCVPSKRYRQLASPLLIESILPSDQKSLRERLKQAIETLTDEDFKIRSCVREVHC